MYRSNIVILISAISAKILLFFVELLPKAFMNPEDYGSFSFYLATTAVLTALFSYGGQNITIKEYSDSNIGVKTFYNAVLIPILIFIIFIPAHFLFEIPFVCVLSALLLALIFNSSTYYRCKGQVSFWYLKKDIIRATIFMLILLITYIGKDTVSYELAVIYFIISLLVSLPFCFKFTKEKYQNLNVLLSVSNILEYLKKATPIIFTGFTYLVLSRMDVAFVKKYHSLAVLGDYTSISRICYQALFFQQICLSKSLPIIAKNFNSNNYIGGCNYAKRMSIFITITTIISGFIIYNILSISSVISFFKFSIHNHMAIALIFIIGYVLISVLSFNSYFLLYTNRQHYGYFNNSCVIIIAGFGYYLFVPEYGITGAAMTTVSALVLGNILEYLEFKFFVKPQLVNEIGTEDFIVGTNND